MPKQEWLCETCGQSGIVDLEEREDVWSVVIKIRDDHERVSSECDTGLTKVRVINQEVIVENSVDKCDESAE